MSTSYIWERGSYLGTAEFPDFDPACECSDAQYAAMRDAYIGIMNAKLEELDDTLTWFPETSEIYGVVGESIDFDGDFEEDWWKPNSESAWEESWEAADSIDHVFEIYADENFRIPLTDSIMDAEDIVNAYIEFDGASPTLVEQFDTLSEAKSYFESKYSDYGEMTGVDTDENGKKYACGKLAYIVEMDYNKDNNSVIASDLCDWSLEDVTICVDDDENI